MNNTRPIETNVRISIDAHKKLKEFCDNHAYKMGKVLSRLIENNIDKLEAMDPTERTLFIHGPRENS